MVQSGTKTLKYIQKLLDNRLLFKMPLTCKKNIYFFHDALIILYTLANRTFIQKVMYNGTNASDGAVT